MQYNRQIKPTNIVVSSILKDTNGNLLENAHVYPKGDTSKGVITNEHGEFTLHNLDVSSYIDISYQGVVSSIRAGTVRKITVINTTNSLPEVEINSNSKPEDNSKNKWILAGVLATIFITRAVLKTNKKKSTSSPKKVTL